MLGKASGFEVARIERVGLTADEASASESAQNLTDCRQ
jgi:hypothetical protein